jgi:hypothetical protein
MRPEVLLPVRSGGGTPSSLDFMAEMLNTMCLRRL